MKLRILLSAAALAILPGGPCVCSADPPSHSAWKMTFGDEFNDTALDGRKWKALDSTTGRASALRPANVELEDGVCRLVVKKESYLGKEWTTAGLVPSSFRQAYGYFEIRMRVPGTSGYFCNFWLYTPQSDRARGHACIDITKILYPRTNRMRVLGNIGGRGITKFTAWTAPQDLDKDYHLYGLEWKEDELIWYFDDREVFRAPKTSCPIKLRPLLLMVVTSAGGEVTDALSGTSWQVDYIRAYKKQGRTPNWSEWQDGIQ